MEKKAEPDGQHACGQKPQPFPAAHRAASAPAVPEGRPASRSQSSRAVRTRKQRRKTAAASQRSTPHAGTASEHVGLEEALALVLGQLLDDLTGACQQLVVGLVKFRYFRPSPKSFTPNAKQLESLLI